MIRLVLSVLAVLTAVPALADMQRVELTAGFYRIEAEVAATPEERAQGLMHRTSLAPSQGMLFVFPVSSTICFWMKNTVLPLSIAFLDEKGVIINIDEMAPQTENNHCPANPARYALEMNAGWFKAKGIKAGSVINMSRTPAGR